MIRLITVGDRAHPRQPTTNIPSPARLNEKHASPEIRLGLRRRRTTTMTLSPEQSPTAISKPLQQNIYQSFIQQRVSPIEDHKPQAKIRMQVMGGIKTRSLFVGEESGVCTSINGLGEAQKKGNVNQTFVGRQIVKLKHNKRRSFSPIEKLAPLLGQSLLEVTKTVNI